MKTSRRNLLASLGALAAWLPWRARAVTVTQMQSADPLYQQYEQITQAINTVTAANGANSILSMTVVLGNAQMSNVGQSITVSVPLNPTQAAPMFTAMATELTALQSALVSQMGGI